LVKLKDCDLDVVIPEVFVVTPNDDDPRISSDEASLVELVLASGLGR